MFYLICSGLCWVDAHFLDQPMRIGRNMHGCAKLPRESALFEDLRAVCQPSSLRVILHVLLTRTLWPFWRK